MGTIIEAKVGIVQKVKSSELVLEVIVISSLIKTTIVRVLWMTIFLIIHLYLYANYALFYTLQFKLASSDLLIQLFLSCYILLYFPAKKFKFFTVQLFYPLITIIGMYLLFLCIYHPVIFSDLRHFFTLFPVMPVSTIFIYLYILLVFFVPIWLVLPEIKQYSKKYLFGFVLIKLILAFFVLFIPWEECYRLSFFAWYELPLLLCCYMILHFPPKKFQLFEVQLLYPLITIVGIYIFYEVIYSYLYRPLKFSDLKNLPTLFAMMPIHTISIFLYFLFIFLIPILFALPIIQQYSKKHLFTVLLRKLVLAFCFYCIITSQFFFNFQLQCIDTAYFNTSDHNEMKQYGCLFYTFYYKNRSDNIAQQLPKRNRIDNYNILWKGDIAQFPNIHIVVLESFMNPCFIKDIDLNMNPLHPNIQKYLIDHQRFSIVKAPTYGGYTPRSEFEILTGTPALSLLDGIEFNVLEGKQLSSFVNKMKKSGYASTASIGSSSICFNKAKAYPSLGFDSVHFIDKNPYFYKQSEDIFIFDGDLLHANAQYVEKHINQSKQPIFNYVLGIYGHIPGTPNFKLRPQIVTINNAPSSHNIQWAANDFYYRTQAVAEYLDYLQKIDPESIILVISDHLPSVLDDKIVYSKDIYDNIAIFIVNGKVIDISGVHYYEIPRIIWGYLQHQDYNGKIEPLTHDILKECYLQLMLENSET